MALDGEDTFAASMSEPDNAPPQASNLTTSAAEDDSSDNTTPDINRTNKAQTVFDLPELLEMILDNLDPFEIIPAAGINRTARYLVKDSQPCDVLWLCSPIMEALSGFRCLDAASRNTLFARGSQLIVLTRGRMSSVPGSALEMLPQRTFQYHVYWNLGQKNAVSYYVNLRWRLPR